MPEERWEPVKGYEGLYEVSDFGRVRSVSRSTVICGQEYKYVGRELSPCLVYGKAFVSLSKNGKVKRVSLPRLVWKTFRSYIPGTTMVYCLDGNALNCRVSNLKTHDNKKAWASAKKKGPTYKDTADYIAHKHGQYLPDPYGELSEEQRAQAREWMDETDGYIRPVVRADGELYESVPAAARAMGVSKAYMRDVVSGKARTCKGYNFRRLTEEDIWGE